MWKIIQKIRLVFITVIRIIFSFLQNGFDCVVCGKHTYLFPVCKNCRDNNFKIKDLCNEKRCVHCGKHLISTVNTCIQCRENIVMQNIDFPFSMFSYRLWNKELMFLWKTEGVRILSYMFAILYAKVLKNLNVEYIVPVPPRPGKLKEKGWDQIDEVCNYLKYFYNFTTLNLLERKSTIQQKKLDREQRLETISSAYTEVSDSRILKELKKTGGVLPEKVALIDDVCTTGSTLECCAKILKSIGIEKIYSVILFTVD